MNNLENSPVNQLTRRIEELERLYEQKCYQVDYLSNELFKNKSTNGHSLRDTVVYAVTDYSEAFTQGLVYCEKEKDLIYHRANEEFPQKSSPTSTSPRQGINSKTSLEYSSAQVELDEGNTRTKTLKKVLWKDEERANIECKHELPKQIENNQGAVAMEGLLQNRSLLGISGGQPKYTFSLPPSKFSTLRSKVVDKKKDSFLERALPRASTKCKKASSEYGDMMPMNNPARFINSSIRRKMYSHLESSNRDIGIGAVEYWGSPILYQSRPPVRQSKLNCTADIQEDNQLNRNEWGGSRGSACPISFNQMMRLEYITRNTPSNKD